jgi:hypothetical protein
MEVNEEDASLLDISYGSDQIYPVASKTVCTRIYVKYPSYPASLPPTGMATTGKTFGRFMGDEGGCWNAGPYFGTLGSRACPPATNLCEGGANNGLACTGNWDCTGGFCQTSTCGCGPDHDDQWITQRPNFNPSLPSWPVPSMRSQFCDSSPGAGDGICAGGLAKGPFRQWGPGAYPNIEGEVFAPDWSGHNGYALLADTSLHPMGAIGGESSLFYSAARYRKTSDPGSPQFTINDCGQSWCRIELCSDYNLDGTNKVRTRDRITRLDTGVSSVRTFTQSERGYATPRIGGYDMKAIWHNMKQNYWTGARSYWSRYMTATNSNAGRDTWWIGPASEIEP